MACVARLVLFLLGGASPVVTPEARAEVEGSLFLGALGFFNFGGVMTSTELADSVGLAMFDTALMSVGTEVFD